MTGISDSEYDAIVEDLAYRYSDTFARDVVASEVATVRTALEQTARKPDFLATLIAKQSRDRLAARAAAAGREFKPVPTILFVCVHNTGRSQFAAALTKQLAGDAVHVRAAGMRPAAGVNPAVAEVLAERGIVIDGEFPTGTPYDVEDAADIVVDMGCDLPQYPARRVVRWDVDDPEGRDAAAVRRICDKIDQRVRRLLVDLEIPIIERAGAVAR
ncbi:low molecular weight phosphatase family protein [Granulicoccus sp. GXG6511]|uniref:arsenate-mycothiol transferase ArsC n=1 Tax=Granulicoccus sp. GXG6511 TaxID=3381351 RepID=UPI003D7D71C7